MFIHSCFFLTFSHLFIFVSGYELRQIEYLEEIVESPTAAPTVMLEVKSIKDGCSFGYIVSEESPTMTTSDVCQFKSHRKKRKIPLHMRPRTKSETSFGCPKCGKAYSLAKNMRRHARLECFQEPKYACSYCPLKCKRNNQLQRHILAKHNNNN